MAKRAKVHARAKKSRAVRAKAAPGFGQPFAALQSGFNSLVGYFK